MKTIKVRERDRTPRIRDGSAKLPRELMKKSLIRAKEKTREVSRETETGETDTAPNEYAQQKISVAGQELVSDAGYAGSYALRAGKQAAKKASEKSRARRKEAYKEKIRREEQQDQETAERGLERELQSRENQSGETKNKRNVG